ncbi:aldehyde dehydrogenase family protein [Nocardia sp. NPDC049149]|uniref:aldehyde dehydrogenase family protein n=1 Tax=Nocardia sp. NPDC049149 TaxID=3364315 RepID=UPI003724B122
MTVSRELMINGKEVAASAGRTTEVISPYTGVPYATVAAAGTEDVTAAIDAAQGAFGEWSALSPFAKRTIFTKAAALLDERAEQAAELMAGEIGATRGWAHFNVSLGANIFREAAAAMTAPRGDVLAAEQEGVLGLSLREPMGVVAAFAPWNAPIILGARAVAAPLAAGNTVVLKPSESAPLSCGMFIADVLRDAGLPAGVLNVVTNDPAYAAPIAETLIADPRVRAVNFTGSTDVGRIIGTLAAKHLKPAVLELGGKNSVIVLDDADIDYAVSAAVFGAFANSGQICMSADRILVHESVAAEFTRKFADAVAGLPTGSPDEPHTVIGPLVNHSAVQKISWLIMDAVDRGATVAAGGGVPQGNVHPATVLTGVPKDAVLYYSEAFGPVCTVATFTTDEQAAALANDTENGLTAGILTENTARALRLMRQLRTGIVHINDQTVADEPNAPFGGFGTSGYGRFGGRWGIEAFTNTRWVTMATVHTTFPG